MSPVAFYIGDFAVRWYGLLITLGIIAGVVLGYFRAKYYGLRKNDLYDLAFLIIVVGVLGARLTYILTNDPGYWFSHPAEILTLQMSGLSFIGIIIFNIPAIAIFARIRKLSFWRILDLAAPSVAAGYFFGRLGCFMNGCCYGPVCEPVGIVMQGTGSLAPVFPTQLLNALAALIMFAVLIWIALRYKSFQGWLFILLIYMYSASSFGSEFLRADPGHSPIFGTPLNSAQYADMALFITAAIFHFILRKSKVQSTISDEQVRAIEEADRGKPLPPKQETKEENK